MNWVQINIQVNEDFRYMKIHIFALRWKDEIFFFFFFFLINFIGILLSYKSNKREVTRTKNCQKGVTNGT